MEEQETPKIKKYVCRKVLSKGKYSKTSIQFLANSPVQEESANMIKGEPC